MRRRRALFDITDERLDVAATSEPDPRIRQTPPSAPPRRRAGAFAGVAALAAALAVLAFDLIDLTGASRRASTSTSGTARSRLALQSGPRRLATRATPPLRLARRPSLAPVPGAARSPERRPSELAPPPQVAAPDAAAAAPAQASASPSEAASAPAPAPASAVEAAAAPAAAPPPAAGGAGEFSFER